MKMQDGAGLLVITSEYYRRKETPPCEHNPSSLKPGKRIFFLNPPRERERERDHWHIRFIVDVRCRRGGGGLRETEGCRHIPPVGLRRTFDSSTTSLPIAEAQPGAPRNGAASPIQYPVTAKGPRLSFLPSRIEPAPYQQDLRVMMINWHASNLSQVSSPSQILLSDPCKTRRRRVVMGSNAAHRPHQGILCARRSCGICS
ncbi:hypothetical protein LY76DRAFT_220871 [Colletotrichum caudatum]|nr:hypothetical protein LY76DRAFT_220871 [Colletotrichum caudatum]